MSNDLDTVFAALADPTRRAILAMLLEDDMAVTDVAEPFEMSLAAISKHLTILASAGLKRLKFDDRIASFISSDEILPAGGQGAVGIELRLEDQETAALLAPLHHLPTAYRVNAERAMNRRLEGGCQVPIGCYAELNDKELHLRGLVADPDGREMIQGDIRGTLDQAEAIGVSLAETLLAAGADRILAAVYAKGD